MNPCLLPTFKVLVRVSTWEVIVRIVSVSRSDLTVVKVVDRGSISTLWQAHGVELGLAGTVVVACTATLAAVGAAAIPSAGLVTMLMVLQVISRRL